VAVSRAMRRLLRVRGLEEGQARLELESALGDLRRLEHALEASCEEDRRGRNLIQTSARSGELPDRLAGLEESRAAGRWARVLAPRIAAQELDVAALREELLDRRVERRQAETLIKETEARDANEAARRGQQEIDDWYRSCRYREDRGVKPAAAPSLLRQPPKET